MAFPGESRSCLDHQPRLMIHFPMSLFEILSVLPVVFATAPSFVIVVEVVFVDAMAAERAAEVAIAAAE